MSKLKQIISHRATLPTVGTLLTALLIYVGVERCPPGFLDAMQRDKEHTANLKKPYSYPYSTGIYCPDVSHVEDRIVALGYFVKTDYIHNEIFIAESRSKLERGEMIRLIVGSNIPQPEMMIPGERIILPDDKIIPVIDLNADTLDFYFRKAREVRDTIRNLDFVVRSDPTNASKINVALSTVDMEEGRSAELWLMRDYSSVQFKGQELKAPIPLAGLERKAFMAYTGLSATQQK